MEGLYHQKYFIWHKIWENIQYDLIKYCYLFIDIILE